MAIYEIYGNKSNVRRSSVTSIKYKYVLFGTANIAAIDQLFTLFLFETIIKFFVTVPYLVLCREISWRLYCGVNSSVLSPRPHPAMPAPTVATRRCHRTVVFTVLRFSSETKNDY